MELPIAVASNRDLRLTLLWQVFVRRFVGFLPAMRTWFVLSSSETINDGLSDAQPVSSSQFACDLKNPVSSRGADRDGEGITINAFLPAVHLVYAIIGTN
jgi:hypothetical protein